MSLNTGQLKAANVVENGGNLFLTGSGGCGKTFLANQLKTKNSITACPTGAAALVAGGSTNHRVFGAPIGVIKPDSYKKVKKDVIEVLQKTDRVFLDEVSMNRIDMFEHIDNCLQLANESKLPFGGKQVVAVGDFFQLGAFVSPNERSFYKQLYGDKMMAFESKSWNFETVELTQPMRNVNTEQLEVLQSIRVGENIAPSLRKLSELSQKYHSDLDWTHLCSYNKDADSRNALKYTLLNTKERVYPGITKGLLKEIQKEVRVPIELKLKLDMRVMILANDPSGNYVNGSTGKVEQMEDDCIIVKLDTGDHVVVDRFKFEVVKYKAGARGITRAVVASMEQFPIALGYACSIHKAQGATLDKAVINLGKSTFADAIFYVAISRVTDFSNLAFVRPPMYNDVRVNKKVISFYKGV